MGLIVLATHTPTEDQVEETGQYQKDTLTVWEATVTLQQNAQATAHHNMEGERVHVSDKFHFCSEKIFGMLHLFFMELIKITNQGFARMPKRSK